MTTGGATTSRTLASVVEGAPEKKKRQSEEKQQQSQLQLSHLISMTQAPLANANTPSSGAGIHKHADDDIVGNS